MIVLVKLLLAHFIGDFILQPASWVREKEKKKALSPKFYLHIALHGLLVGLVLWDLKDWPLAVLIMLVHGGIDLIKMYGQKKQWRAQWFLIDQSLHLLSLILVGLLYFKPEITLPPLDMVWIYAAALLFLTAVSGISIQILMSNWSEALGDGTPASLKAAGKYIGLLERLFVFTFVVTGHWEGIGFLLAAKSVFRFGDLRKSKDRRLTEYVMIGTLLSFGMALATGLLVTAYTIY